MSKDWILGRHLRGRAPGNDLPGHVKPKPPDEDMDEYMEHMKGFFPPGVYIGEGSTNKTAGKEN